MQMKQTSTTATAPTTAAKSIPAPQIFGNTEVRIRKAASGQRAAEIVPFGRVALRFYVPLEMLSLAAGKDAWMREIQFKCTDCGTKHAAKDMECEMCPECNEKAMQSNADADNS